MPNVIRGRFDQQHVSTTNVSMVDMYEHNHERTCLREKQGCPARYFWLCMHTTSTHSSFLLHNASLAGVCVVSPKHCHHVALACFSSHAEEFKIV